MNNEKKCKNCINYLKNGSHPKCRRNNLIAYSPTATQKAAFNNFKDLYIPVNSNNIERKSGWVMSLITGRCGKAGRFFK